MMFIHVIVHVHVDCTLGFIFMHTYTYLHSNIFGTSRSTPVEVLHSILPGPYKYLLKTTIPLLTPLQKKEVLARMSAFNYSGFNGRVIGNIIYHKSFVGRDCKAWAQMALFIIGPYLSDCQKSVLFALSKVYIHYQGKGGQSCKNKFAIHIHVVLYTYMYIDIYLHVHAGIQNRLLFAIPRM